LVSPLSLAFGNLKLKKYSLFFAVLASCSVKENTDNQWTQFTPSNVSASLSSGILNGGISNKHYTLSVGAKHTF
jgi:outer membrane protease